MAGATTFRQEYMTSSQNVDALFNTPSGRRLRYQLLWGYFENNAYESVHTWSTTLKAAYALYRYTRHLYNPAYRLGNFWSVHLMGGALDPNAGDGSIVPTALPIITDSPKAKDLRMAIAQVWDWSNWGHKKDLYTLLGPVLGDVFIQVNDDPSREKVYLEVIHPSWIEEMELDPFGNVKAYYMTHEIEHPTDPSKSAIYGERCFRAQEDAVVFQTTLNGNPYRFNDRPEEWVEPYGFVPLVFVPHIDVGSVWGWAEIHANMSKVRECDDLASKLSDHIRKSVDPPWLFNFSKPRDAETKMAAPAATTSAPQVGREEVKAMYVPQEAAKGQALIAELSYPGVLQHLTGLVSQIEREYPELRFDNLRLEGAVSGSTLMVARQPAEAKVIQRRTVYDGGLVRAQNMAVAIGGYRGYESFSGFDLESYAAGDLTHSIASRPVFTTSEVDALAEERVFWETADIAIRAGVPLESFLKLHNWPQEKIDLVIVEEEEEEIEPPDSEEEEVIEDAVQGEEEEMAEDQEEVENASPDL